MQPVPLIPILGNTSSTFYVGYKLDCHDFFAQILVIHKILPLISIVGIAKFVILVLRRMLLTLPCWEYRRLTSGRLGGGEDDVSGVLTETFPLENTHTLCLRHQTQVLQPLHHRVTLRQVLPKTKHNNLLNIIQKDQGLNHFPIYSHSSIDLRLKA